MHVKKVDLVTRNASIIGALLCHDGSKAIRKRVDDSGADASACCLPSHHYRVDSQIDEVGHERRAKECAGPLLVDDPILRTWREGPDPQDAEGPDCLSKLSRYETMIERSLYRALHELQRLQAARAGQATAPPLALDFDSLRAEWRNGFVSQKPPGPRQINRA